jgi:hypothetical protein
MTVIKKTRSLARTTTFTLTGEEEARRQLEVIRYVFLSLMLVGYIFYPLDLWILGHYLDSWQSRIPFWLALPSTVFTALMLVDYRRDWIRYPFLGLMIVNVLTGLAGAIFHLVFNFEGEVTWTVAGFLEAFKGSRPVLAALAFTQIGVTGLLCSIVAPPRKK